MSDRGADYGRLVVPGGNSEEPFHRWFHLKEAFSSQLLARLLKDAAYDVRKPLRILDPFLGSGTTLLSGMALSEQRIDVSPVLAGIERNPLIFTVASAKVTGALRGRSLAALLRHALPQVEAAYARRKRGWRSLETSSVTLNDPKYFSVEHKRALLALRSAIDVVEDPDVRAILLCCLAATVEPSGQLRRDGRALRYTPERVAVHPLDGFYRGFGRALEDLDEQPDRSSKWQAEVLLGDARLAQAAAAGKTFDWIVFSPPYPNNIDYTEVYKTEAWALGCYESVDHMKEQRQSTLRSHPSIRFPDTYNALESIPERAADQLLRPILEAVPDDRYAQGRLQVIKGYADDMLRVFAATRRVVAADGRLVYVVGNSLHGSTSRSFVIAADLILAALAEMCGWNVEEIRVARTLKRRGAAIPYLRESVVVLRPS